MPPALLPLLTFLAVVLGIFAVYSLFSDVYQRDRRRIQERLDADSTQSKQREKVKRSLLFKERQQGGNQPEDAAEARLSFRERIQAMIDQAGLEMTERRLLGFCGGAAVGGGLLLGMIGRGSLVLCLGGTVLGGATPLIIVNIKRNARLEALRSQLPDAFDLMARILRAGQSITQAMLGVATEFTSPIAEEFAYCFEQQNLGLAPEISLRDLARRTGLVEMNIFVVAVLVQRSVGGNLSEILERLAQTVRERYKIRGEIQGLTAEGRLQAMVLMVLPVFLFLIMLFLNRDYALVLIDEPGLLWGMVTFMALGGLWIRKIVNFDF